MDTAFVKISTVLLLVLALSACEHTATGPKDMPLDSLAVIAKAFNNPEVCEPCHPNHYKEWRTSTHAYAFTDPIFFRLNEIGQQRSNNELDQFCIKCHSPVGSMLLETEPGFNPENLSVKARNAIQCDVCHSIETFERGKAIKTFRMDGVKQGSIPDPIENSFHASKFDRRYPVSFICTPCHDVFSPNDLQVEFTSLEWDNSPYAANSVECQACHMPAYTGQAAPDAPVRQLHRHTFLGVDIPLVDFPGRAETITQVDALLKNAVTMNVTVPGTVSGSEVFQLEIEIVNDKTGHSVPSGATFERQMWLEIVVKNEAQETIYSSGLLDSNGDLLTARSEFVKNGTIPKDSDLALFHGKAFTGSEETLFFWEADRVENNTIPPFGSKTASYEITAPEATGGLQIFVRLRFRTFPPYLLRAIQMDELIDDLIIFDMATSEKTVMVQ